MEEFRLQIKFKSIKMYYNHALIYFHIYVFVNMQSELFCNEYIPVYIYTISIIIHCIRKYGSR